jgi:hypothetical protein
MASEWDDALTLCERNGRQGEHERARACRRRLHVRFFVNTGLGTGRLNSLMPSGLLWTNSNHLDERNHC